MTGRRCRRWRIDPSRAIRPTNVIIMRPVSRSLILPKACERAMPFGEETTSSMRAGAFGASVDRRCLVEKECRCYVQSERDPLEPTSADAIGAALVLSHLLNCDPDSRLAYAASCRVPAAASVLSCRCVDQPVSRIFLPSVKKEPEPVEKRKRPIETALSPAGRCGEGHHVVGIRWSSLR